MDRSGPVPTSNEVDHVSHRHQGPRISVPFVASLLMFIAACGQATPSAPPSTDPASSPSAASVAPSIGPSAATIASVGASLPACLDDATWRCLTVDVPIDRKDPSLGTIPIHAYVQSRTDLSDPPAEPIIVTPGGPGASIWRDHGWLPMADWQANHDTVLIDPRGVGASGVIDCPELEAGAHDVSEVRAAAAACATKLGPAADRYGAPDVALDIEAVRDALGIEAFDYYGASYATVDQQAYAARFPERLHALVLDSGFPQVDTLDGYFWGVDYPGASMRVLGLLCARDATCAKAHPDPRAEIGGLAARIRKEPIVAKNSLDVPVTINEGAIAMLTSLLGRQDWQLSAGDLLDAAAAAQHGSPDKLAQLVNDHPTWSGGGGGDIAGFSQGDNAAAQCVDGAFPWDPADAPDVRAKKFDAALKALPDTAFAPFSAEGWASGYLSFLALCFDWPAPKHIEPIIPDVTALASIPTLILSGELDLSAPTEVNKPLQTLFPQAPFVVVAGAGHDAAAPFMGACGGPVVAKFFDTLKADPGACSTPPR